MSSILYFGNTLRLSIGWPTIIAKYRNTESLTTAILAFSIQFLPLYNSELKTPLVANNCTHFGMTAICVPTIHGVPVDSYKFHNLNSSNFKCSSYQFHGLTHFFIN